jgi:hypothetical protein
MDIIIDNIHSKFFHKFIFKKLKKKKNFFLKFIIYDKNIIKIKDSKNIYIRKEKKQTNKLKNL